MQIPVQCIFQGGGAKLVTLLAAAEALEDRISDKSITVNQVAGTSAGSIIAYLLAGKTPIKEYRDRLVSEGKSAIEKLDLDVGRLKVGWKIAFGKPIYSDDIIRDILHKITYDFDGKLDIPVYVRAADMYDSELITFRIDGMSKESAIRTLVDSCAVPLAFRTYLSQSTIVDGGIGSNLIDQSIFSPAAENVIAFSFEKSGRYRRDNLIQYGMALASTMIDNSVREAAHRIKSAGGFVCELPNKYDTFDFVSALNKGLEIQNYKEMKNVASIKIDQALEHFYKRDRTEKIEKKYSSLSTSYSKSHETIVGMYPYDTPSAAMICISNCLYPANHPQRNLPDELVKHVAYIPTKGDLYAFRTGIAIGPDVSLGSDVDSTIVDAHGNEIEFDREILLIGSGESAEWFAYYLLRQPLHASNSPARLTQKTRHIGMMRGLRDVGLDWARQKSTSPQVDIVIAVPNSSRDLVMTDLLANQHRLARATVSPHDAQTMHERWFQGTAMSVSELKQYKRFITTMHEPKLFGWTGQNVPIGCYLGALIETK